jgi:hypothetical protein
VLCRMAQNGQDGSWAAEDYDGNPLEVRTSANRTLEILHHPDNGNGDIAGENEFGMKSPIEDRRRAADERLIAAQLAPRDDARAPDQRNPSGIRALQGLLDRHYAQR